jgi:hypothetical protein
MSSKLYFILALIFFNCVKAYTQEKSGLKISFFLEEDLKPNEIKELLNSKGFTRKNLNKIDIKIYNFESVSNRSVLDYDGIPIDIISEARQEICKSCELLKDLLKSSENKKVLLIKSSSFNSECLNPRDYELMPNAKELDLLVKKEKKQSNKSPRHIVIWYPKPTISVKEFTVNNNIKPIQIDNGDEIKIDFFINTPNSFEELVWTNEYNTKYSVKNKYEPGYNSEKFKPSVDSKYCLNYFPHKICPEKICTDIIMVENKVNVKPEPIISIKPLVLEGIPIIKNYKNKLTGKTEYILNEMEDGGLGAKYEVALNGNSEYLFIVPKHEGIEEYKLSLTKLQFRDKPNNIALLDLKFDSTYKDNNFIRLSLLQTELYYQQNTPVSESSFLQYEVTNSAGKSIHYIESEIKIIPTKIKKGYVYDDEKSESVKVIFQFCNH